MAIVKIGGLSSGRLDLGREAQESFSRDKLTFFVFLFNIVSILTQASLILVSWGTLPSQIPIFYSRPWGELILGPPIAIWILPSINLGFFLVNYFLVLSLVKSNFFLSRVLVIFSLLIAIMTLYDTAKIVSLIA